MCLTTEQDSAKWYVLIHIDTFAGRNEAQRSVDKFNSHESEPVELFAPTYVTREVRDGRVVYHKAQLTYYYAFAHGTPQQIKRLCADSNGFSFLIDRVGQSRYAIVDDRKMREFKEISRLYENRLPIVSVSDNELEHGDLVEVVRGELPGLIGRYIPRPKSKSGNLLIELTGGMAAAVFDIPVSDVRILEFAHDTTRAYDRIDAVVPQLLEALPCIIDGSSLPSGSAARLTAFCERMSHVHISNRKLEAKLYVLLSAAYRMLGDTLNAEIFEERYTNLRSNISNPWTVALAHLLLGTVKHDPETVAQGYESIRGLTPSSKAQTMLVDAYRQLYPITVQ